MNLVLSVHPFGQGLYVLMSLTKCPRYLSVHIAFCVGKIRFDGIYQIHVVV